MSLASAVSVGRESDVRERIFVAALRHFSQKGYAATSLREVSEDALTTKPMIYYYFGSKDGLYSSIVREILEEMAADVRRHIAPSSSLSEQVMAFATAYLDYFLAKEETIALVLREVFGLGGAPMAEFANTLGERVRQPLDEILRVGMEDGVFRQDDIFAVATAITGILNMFILSHVFGGTPIDRAAPLQQVSYYIAGLTDCAAVPGAVPLS